MPSLFVANWKENGTISQAQDWIKTFAKKRSVLNQGKNVVVCSPFTALSTISEVIKKERLPIAIGAQNVSHFEEGRYTGEVSARMLAEFASYTIIGHSERRNNFGETDQIVAEKVKLAEKYNITPIVCISELEQVKNMQNFVSNFTDIIAYEPLFAIGSGNPDTPENANMVAEKIKEIFPQVMVLYGGSVDGTNVASFIKQDHISGVLLGNRSLDGNFFLEIVRNAH